jgi:glycosyltransferase involved in cell wall biosynthesis
VRTLIIVPAYNEEAALPDTLCELRRAQPDADVAVVDDGSRDRTSAVARDAGAIVLALPFNLGVGAAVRTGLRCAAARGYERAIVVDADGQHDAAGVARLLDALDAGADLVIGSRFAHGAPEYVTGRVRRRAMRLLQRIVRVRTGQDLTDVTSGYRGFSRRIIELLASEYPAEYLADTVEAILIVHDNGGTIVEVPVPMRARAAGTPSTRGIGLMLNYLRLLVGILSSTVFPRRRVSAQPTGKEPS